MTYKSILGASLCAIASVLAIGAFRQTVVASVAPDNVVSIYTGPNYSGTELLFSPEQSHRVTLKTQYQNQVSSLSVPQGYEVLLIDTDSGVQKTFGAGNHAFVGEQMNNRAAPVVVSYV